MNLPKIEFRPMSLEENVRLIKWFYFGDRVEEKITKGYKYISDYFNKKNNVNKM